MIKKISVLPNRYSCFTFWVLCLLIVLLRINTLSENELSWDVFGYYLYLPSTFIHHDPFLKDISWMKELLNARPVSATLYQISMGPKDHFVYFYLMGMSVLYTPFFFLGGLIAGMTGMPADGFSLPYQYTLALGFLFYTFLGLYYFRKILLQYFSDQICAIILVIIVLGTNFLQYATVKNLEQTNMLFNLIVILIWYTIRWHQDHKTRHIIFIGLSYSMMVLIKPSELFSILIPLFWGVYDKDSWKAKWSILKQYKSQVLIACGAGFLLFLPQLLYWKIAAGSWIYDSYKNPGVGLDLFSPHIGNVLFSFRKGWIVYTPLMLLSLSGFYFLYKSRKDLFWPVAIYFAISFWIISSWTEWWYGASYSIRPFIPSYALLAIPMGFTINKISGLKLHIKWIWSLIITAFIALNLFQCWQFNQGILSLSRTTRAYYFSVFGKTHIPPGAEKLLLVERSATGFNRFNTGVSYKTRILSNFDFSNIDPEHQGQYVTDSISHNTYYKLDSLTQFSPNIQLPYKSVTSGEYAWIRADVDIFIPAHFHQEPPLLVLTFARKNGLYDYHAIALPHDSIKYNSWNHLHFDYLTPEVRSRNDKFQSYLWYQGKDPVYIDNFKIQACSPDE